MIGVILASILIAPVGDNVTLQVRPGSRSSADLSI